MTAYLPPPRRPPHDPFRLPLDARAGFRVGLARGVEVSPIDGALAFAPAAHGGRRLNEPNGSFGGLVPPPNVAVTPDRSVFLLDASTGRLKRFDPCRCHFDVVPCLGGFGSAPRQVASPGGIGSSGGNLFVADAGNARVQVFTLRGFALRSLLVPPREQTPQPFRPVAVAFSRRGDALVADPNNGSIHVFSPSGRWLRRITGVGAVKSVAVDCDERLYVFAGSELPVRVLELASGTELETRVRADEVAEGFARLPFEVTPRGGVALGSFCVDGAQRGTGEFDATGAPLSDVEETSFPPFVREGTYVSTALDSELHRCEWDRLTLRARVPNGTRIRVLTYTAETELGSGEISQLPDGAWSTRQELEADPGAADWDCLIRSQPGRYLWLKLEFEGDGAKTPRVERALLDFPRISLGRYLPAVFRREPNSADFTDRFLAIFDRGFREVESRVDRQAELFDPLSAPAEGRNDFLSWLASWTGVIADRRLPLARRRRLVKQAGKLIAKRGTLSGLRSLIEVYLGLTRECASLPHCGPCKTPAAPKWQPPELILEHFKLRRWLYLGAGHLGNEAVLWGQKVVNRSQLSGPETQGNAQLGVSQLKTSQDPLRDPFHHYAHKFSIFVPAWISRSPQERRSLERLLASEKPAHTAHRLVFVEPRFRIGIQSVVGFDAVVGCYPQGICLDASALGKATVLGPGPAGGAGLRVATESRLGTTTRLT
jgi:phage tail-like protein